MQALQTESGLDKVYLCANRAIICTLSAHLNKLNEPTNQLLSDWHVFQAKGV